MLPGFILHVLPRNLKVVWSLFNVERWWLVDEVLIRRKAAIMLVCLWGCDHWQAAFWRLCRLVCLCLVHVLRVIALIILSISGIVFSILLAVSVALLTTVNPWLFLGMPARFSFGNTGLDLFSWLVWVFSKRHRIEIISCFAQGWKYVRTEWFVLI